MKSNPNSVSIIVGPEGGFDESEANYLDKLGFNGDLLRCFANIYDDSIDNTTPLPYLDYLTILNEKATWDSFLEHKTLAIRPKL